MSKPSSVKSNLKIREGRLIFQTCFIVFCVSSNSFINYSLADNSGSVNSDETMLFDFQVYSAYGTLTGICPTGSFAADKQYISPPLVEWELVDWGLMKSCARYELLLVQDDKILGITPATQSPKLIEEGWDKLQKGKKAAIIIRGFDEKGEENGLSGMRPFYVKPFYPDSGLGKNIYKIIKPHGYFALGARYINTPRVEWESAEGCTRYELILVQGDDDDVLGITKADSSPHFIENGWDNIRRCKKAGIIIHGFDKEGRLIAVSEKKTFYTALDYDPAVSSRKKRSYRQAALMAFDAVYNYKLPAGTPIPTEGPGSRIHQILLSAAHGPHSAYPFSYPVSHDHHYVNMLVALNKIADEPLRKKIMEFAESAGTHLLISRFMEEGFKYKGMIRSCCDYNGNPAGGYESAKLQLLELPKCGYATDSLVKLYELTGKQKYLDAALEMAEIFVNTQLEDGSWPARVDAKSGKVLTEYSTSTIAVANLLDRLNKHIPDDRWINTRDKAVKWILDNPARTYAWVLNFADGDSKASKANLFGQTSSLSNVDCFEFIRYLSCHPEATVDAAGCIKEQFMWIDNHFTFYGDGPLLSFNPHYPSIAEQGSPAFYVDFGNCWCPMAGHTNNWGRALLAAHLLTGNNLYLEKAKAAANTLTQVQVDNGGTLTWMPDKAWGLSFRGAVGWSNSTFWPAGWASSAALWADLAAMGME